MNTKQTLLLLILAIGLSAAAVWYGRHEEQLDASARADTAKVTEGITSSTVERIEIAVPEASSVTLTRMNDVWYTDPAKNFAADKNAVNNLFSALEKPLEGEVVSEKKENHSSFNVDETSATRVKMFKQGDDKPLTDLFIGKDGTSAFTTFVRKADDNKVVNAHQSLSYLFKRPEGWRDKVVFNIQSDSIGGLSAEGTSATYELQKIAGTWTMTKPDNRKADSGKVSTMLSMVSNLRTNEFPQTTGTLAELGLDPPRQKFTITYEDKGSSPAETQKNILLIGNQRATGTDYYAKRADNESVYSISEYIVKALAPELNELAPPPPAPETTGTATSETETTAGESGKTETIDASTTASESQPASETAKPAADAKVVETAATAAPADQATTSSLSPVDASTTIGESDKGTTQTP